MRRLQATETVAGNSPDSMHDAPVRLAGARRLASRLLRSEKDCGTGATHGLSKKVSAAQPRKARKGGTNTKRTRVAQQSEGMRWDVRGLAYWRARHGRFPHADHRNSDKQEQFTLLEQTEIKVVL